MFYNRSVALAAAFAVAVGLPVLTAADAGAIYLPWTVQTVFALAPDNSYVAEWNGPGAGWTVIGGPASEVYAGSAGVFATDGSGSDIWMYNGTPNSWTKIGGPGAQFVEGGGHLYGLGPDSSYVAEWNGPGAGWTVIGGAAGQIAAGPYGLVATGPGSGGDIWRYNGTPGSWTEIGGPPSSTECCSLAVGADGVYRIDPTDAAGTVVDKWAGGTTWTPILTVGSSSEVSDLIVGDAGVYLWKISPTVNGFFKYDGSPNDWSQITMLNADNKGLLPQVESATSLYGVTLDLSGAPTANVEIYSGSGSSWTVIGGPADRPLAAGA